MKPRKSKKVDSAVARDIISQIAGLQARVEFLTSLLETKPSDKIITERDKCQATLNELTALAGMSGVEVSASELAKRAQLIIQHSENSVKRPGSALDESTSSIFGRPSSSSPESRLEKSSDTRRLHGDFVYFCSRCLPIPYRPGINKSHPDGGFGQFILSEGQARVISEFIRIMLVKEKPLRVIELKTRQLGNTTLLLAFAVWLMVKFPHYHVMLIIDKGPHAKTKRNMVVAWLDYIAGNFSEAFNISIAKGGRGEKHVELDNGSMFLFESAESPNPGTSEMIHFLIESEKPKWPAGRAEQVRTSVLPGIPYAKYTAHIDESTAEGIDPFKRKWDRVTSEPSEIIPIFLPWTISNEYRETPPEDFHYLNDDEELFDWSEDEDRFLTEEEYAGKYGLDDSRICWRRKKIKLSFDGVRASFDQEYPTTPDHAWRQFQIGFFSSRLLKYFRDATDCAVFTRGTLNDVGGYIDVSRPILYTQVHPSFKEDRHGNIFIRETPRVGEEYFVGVDTAEGKVVTDESGKQDPDSNVFAVKDSKGKSVAYLISRERPEHLWLDLLLFSIYYNMAFVNGERNNTGLTLMAFFTLTGYPNNLVYAKPHGAPVVDRMWTYVSSKNRAPLLQNLRASLTAVFERIFAFVGEESPLKQYANFIINTKSGKPEASSGFHDDIVMADAHSEQCRRWRYGDAVASEFFTKVDDSPTSLNVDAMFYDEVIETQGGIRLCDTDYDYLLQVQ